MAADGIIMTPGLGRPFTLGMLYDKRRDELLPGVTLWNKETIQNNTKEDPQPSSEFHVSASDSTESKSSLLNIDASLKASLFGGLVEVGGSAKFFNDSKQSHNQCRVTCQYKATTTFKQLLVTNLQANETTEAGSGVKGLATHVVTGICYGVNTFFVFDSQKTDSSKIQDIQTQMEGMVKSIPSFNVGGKVDIRLSEEQRKLANSFSCTFFGDILLKSNPSSFEEAVKTYIDLPSLIQGENKMNVVPQLVWLMPLKHLDPQAAEVKSTVSIRVVRKAEQMFDNIREMKMRCNDNLERSIFPQIRQKLSSFHKLCDYYVVAIQRILGKNLPLIRAGDTDESAVTKMLEGRDTSAFSYAKLNAWMENTEKEISV